jgi:hypothetical protein
MKACLKLIPIYPDKAPARSDFPNFDNRVAVRNDCTNQHTPTNRPRASDAGRLNKPRASRTSPRNWRTGATNCSNSGAMCFSSCLRQGTRYPFVLKVSLSAKQSRCIRRTGTRSESLTVTYTAIPRPRTVREQNADAAYACPPTVRVGAQSAPAVAFTNSPHPRTHYGFNSPGPGIGSGRNLSADSAQSRTVHVREHVADENSP